MADTRRSISTLTTTTFADGQGAGEITPQDIRDLITSLRPAYARIYISSSSATTISAGGTYVKMAGTTTVDGSFLFNTSTNNRMTYTGASSILAEAIATISLSGSENNSTIGVAFAKNGTVESASIMTVSVGTGSDTKEVVISDLVTLDTDDYLEIFVTYLAKTGTITASKAHFSIIGHPT